MVRDCLLLMLHFSYSAFLFRWLVLDVKCAWICFLQVVSFTFPECTPDEGILPQLTGLSVMVATRKSPCGSAR